MITKAYQNILFVKAISVPNYNYNSESSLHSPSYIRFYHLFLRRLFYGHIYLAIRSSNINFKRLW